MLQNGAKYRFDYPTEFVSLPEYSARRGQMVEVVRPLTKEEAQEPDEEQGFTQMYRIRAEDGWTGDAWEEELTFVLTEETQDLLRCL